jgi:mRNA interferase MazF
MVIRQGDVFWLDLGAAPGLRRPVVVVQNDAFNRSRISTAVVCAVTSSLARAAAPGNVALRKDEANLPRRSVVNVSQIATVDKIDLRDKIGSLSDSRVREILDGISLVLAPTE